MQNINVNIVPDSYPQTIRYSQGDVGREFKINVVGFTIPAGATVKIQATKPSGFGFSVAGTVDGNAVSFTTTAIMTDEAGRFPAELEIAKDSVVIGTANFIMWGEANPHPEGTTDGQQGTIIPELTLLVERVEAAASSVLDMEVVAETLPAGSQATYSYDEDLNKATFGIPQGEAGAGAAGVVASAYSASATYKVGDYVIHNSNLYRCTTAITTAEAFTAAHWTQIVLANDVSDLKTDLDEYADIFTGNVDESVKNWLEEHPEATTSVQDHSLTNKKLVIDTLNYVVPEMFGAIGDGETNDSVAFQSAVSIGLPIVLNPNKSYLVGGITIDKSTKIFGKGAIIKPTLTQNNNRYNTAFTANGEYDVLLDGINFEGYTDVTDDSSLQIPLLLFKNLNSLTINKCCFKDFRQPDSTNPSNYVERVGAIIGGLDIKKTTIHDCEISYCWGDELIWIVPNELNRGDMSIQISNNRFLNNKVSVIDFIGGTATINDNYYYFDDIDTSGLNIFAITTVVNGDCWDGAITNCYDNTEGGRFSGGSFKASNIEFNNTIHNEYNDASCFYLKALDICINNCIAKSCDVFVIKTGLYNTTSHKDSDTAIISKIDLDIDNCIVNYGQFVIYSFVFANSSNCSNIINGCVLTPIDNNIYKSLALLRNEIYIISNSKLQVYEVAQSTIALFNVGTKPYYIMLTNNIIIPKNGNATIFHGEVNASVISCIALSVATSQPLSDDSTSIITASGNRSFIETFIAEKYATSNSYAVIAKPLLFKDGFLRVSNDDVPSITMMIPLYADLFDGTDSYIITGYNGGRATIMIGANNNITLVNYTYSGGSIEQNAKTKITLTYHR